VLLFSWIGFRPLPEADSATRVSRLRDAVHRPSESRRDTLRARLPVSHGPADAVDADPDRNGQLTANR